MAPRGRDPTAVTLAHCCHCHALHLTTYLIVYMIIEHRLRRTINGNGYRIPHGSAPLIASLHSSETRQNSVSKRGHTQLPHIRTSDDPMHVDRDEVMALLEVEVET